jgi:hypothetical protein
MPLDSRFTAPATKAVAVTAADSDLAIPARALYVGGAGNISLILSEDSSAVTFSNVPAGTILPFQVKQVRSTNTTATLIVALY